MIKITNQQAGFTLIETFVAIVVLMIVVLGPMTLLSRALFDARYIKDEIIATYLAQEGVELMIDKKNQGTLSSGEASDCQIKLDETAGYQCGLGNSTIFHRTVVVEDVGSNQMKITSTVDRDNSSRVVVSSSIIFVNP